MVGSSPSEKGTVYVGDGAYGALIEEMCRPDVTMDIFMTFSKSNNFWVSDIYADRVEHVAYNSHNQIIDKFTQYVSDYQLGETPITHLKDEVLEEGREILSEAEISSKEAIR